MTQEELAKHIGFARNYISMLERGKKKAGKRFLEAIEQMEKGIPTSSQTAYPQKSEASIISDEKRFVPFQTAPLISWASAGAAHAYEDQGPNVPRVPTTCGDPHAYCLEIEGDSMEPDYKRGDIVVVAPSRHARTGELVIVRTNKDDTYFKIYTGSEDPHEPIKLSSFNRAYPVIQIKKADLRAVHPVHSVVRMLRKD